MGEQERVTSPNKRDSAGQTRKRRRHRRNAAGRRRGLVRGAGTGLALPPLPVREAGAAGRHGERPARGPTGKAMWPGKRPGRSLSVQAGDQCRGYTLLTCIRVNGLAAGSGTRGHHCRGSGGASRSAAGTPPQRDQAFSSSACGKITWDPATPTAEPAGSVRRSPRTASGKISKAPQDRRGGSAR
jgi:hypothetical protein